MTAPRSLCTPGFELAAVMATGDGRATMRKMRELRDGEAEFLRFCGYDDKAARFLSTCALSMIHDEALKLDCMTGVE
jgi:hypothetical protein